MRRGAALVLGAGGQLGSAIVRALLARGLRVTAVVRRAGVPSNLAGAPVSIVHLADERSSATSSSPASVDQLAQLARGHDVLFDCAAPYPIALLAEPSAPTAAALADHHARLVLGAVERTGVSLVHLGSWVGAGPRRGDPFSQYAHRAHPYFEVKARLESALLGSAARGLPVSIVRLTMLVGPWDVRPRRLCLIPQLVAGEHPVVPDAHLDLLDVRDAAHLVVELASRGTSPLELLLRGHATTLPAAATQLATIAGAPRPRSAMPSAAGVLALTAWETLHARGLAPEGPPALGAMLLHEMEPGPRSPVQEALGAPLRALDETLRDAVECYRGLGYC